MTARVAPFAVLLALGGSWGITVPLGKVAVSGGHGPLGLIFWQSVISVAVLAAAIFWRGTGLPRGLAAWMRCTVIGFVGAILPNSAVYIASRHLPAGILAIELSLVPMIAFPIALLLGLDRFSLVRLGGLICGLVGVALIVVPDASLPDPAMLIWVPVGLIAALCYGMEGNIVAKWGLAGLDPVQLLFGASLVGVVVALPAALLSGQWIDPIRPWGAPDVALVVVAVVSALTYCGYVWTIGYYGAIFAVQVSYLVTAAGVLWSILLLGESYSGWIWAAFGVMLLGMALVRPREVQPGRAGAPS